MRPSSRDSKIEFIAASGTGLTTAEVSQISGEVRDIVREQFTPQPVDLPPDFPFSEFKVIGSGANQVVALPIQVSDSHCPQAASDSSTKTSPIQRLRVRRQQGICRGPAEAAV